MSSVESDISSDSSSSDFKVISFWSYPETIIADTQEHKRILTEKPIVNCDVSVPVKRARAKPLTAFEKAILLDLVAKNRKVLESKKTDFGTTIRKHSAWDKLTLEFCAYPETINRTTCQLKKALGNFKTRANDEVKLRKRAPRKTGGGEKPEGLSLEAEKIFTIVPNLMNALHNNFDFDAEDILLTTNEETPHVCNTAGIQANSFHNQTAAPVSTPKILKDTVPKRKQNDPRSSLMDMQYEQHKLRLKSIHMEYNLNQKKRMLELHHLEIEHNLRKQVLSAQLSYYQSLQCNTVGGSVLDA